MTLISHAPVDLARGINEEHKKAVGGLLLQSLGNKAEVGQELNEGLSLMETALEKLDAAGAPGHIGAHLDLAIAQLRDHLFPPDPMEKIPRIGIGSR